MLFLGEVVFRSKGNGFVNVGVVFKFCFWSGEYVNLIVFIGNMLIMVGFLMIKFFLLKSCND